MEYIQAIEAATGKTAIIKNLPAQAGDLIETAADISLIENDLGYKSKLNTQTGIKKFVAWYRAYYSI
jgi:UDP-glucuronate 4-epimerase